MTSKYPITNGQVPKIITLGIWSLVIAYFSGAVRAVRPGGLHAPGQAASRRALHRLPRGGQAQGRPAARFRGRHPQGQPFRRCHRSRRQRRQLADQGRLRRQGRQRHAPQGGTAVGAAKLPCCAAGSTRAPGHQPRKPSPKPIAARHWSFQPMARPEPCRQGRTLGPQRHRSFHPGPAGEGGNRAVSRSRPRHAHSPAQPRPDRPAAHARRGRRLPRRLAGPTLTSSWWIACWPRPHYGERWGRHWLDLARYADSNGYSIDAPRSIWKYRDWVIDALNRDMPFDRFTIEQLAGDLLPNATLEQRVATGFHRNTQINEEGGIDLEQFRVESIVDRVNTTGTVLLGLTVGCCQCHDHKFDPICPARVLPVLRLLQQRRRADPGAGHARAASRSASDLAPAHGPGKAAQDTGPVHRRAAGEVGRQPVAEARGQLPKNIQDILAIAVNGRNARQERTLLTAFRNIDQTRHVVGGLATASPFAPALHLHTLTMRRALEVRVIELKQQVPVDSDDAGGAGAQGAAHDLCPARRRLPAQGRGGHARHTRGAASTATKGQVRTASTWRLGLSIAAIR